MQNHKYDRDDACVGHSYTFRALLPRESLLLHHRESSSEELSARFHNDEYEGKRTVSMSRS